MSGAVDPFPNPADEFDHLDDIDPVLLPGDVESLLADINDSVAKPLSDAEFSRRIKRK